MLSNGVHNIDFSYELLVTLSLCRPSKAKMPLGCLYLVLFWLFLMFKVICFSSLGGRVWAMECPL